MTARVLMCSPRFMPALQAEHCWAPDSDPLDLPLAIDQWGQLRALVSEHVAPVTELPAEPWARAMTFTRDLFMVAGEVVVPLMPVSRRGPFESPLVQRHLVSLGYELHLADQPLRLDGGNVLVDSHGRLLVGVTSADLADETVTALRFLERATGRPAYRVPVAGGRFPHLDMALCDLSGRGWLVYPDALPGFDQHDPDWAELLLGRPVVLADPLAGEQLACNLIVHGDTAIGPPISDRLRAELASLGMTYVQTPLSEFRKAGGSAHCLTLELPSYRAPHRDLTSMFPA